MVDLLKDVKYIKGVGPARVNLLNKLNIFTLEDLISYFPRGYEDRSIPKKIEDLIDGEEALIEVVCISRISEIRIRKNMVIYKLQVKDETGNCQITWFNQAYLKNKFKIGEKYKFFGKAKKKMGQVEMNSPVFDNQISNKNTGRIIPLYPSTYKLSQNTIRQIIENGFAEINNKLEETMPEYLLDMYGLQGKNEAMRNIHFPENFDKYNKARKRLVFEELLTMQLALLNLKNGTQKNMGIKFDKNVNMSDVIYRLPYKLTNAQKRVLEEIDADMEDTKQMNRLLQGDVGSRKNSSINDSII